MSREQTTRHSESGQEWIWLGGSRPLLPEQIRARVAAGARLVRFEFCVSLLLFTIRRQSPIYLTESWQGRYLRGLAYSLVAIALGLWGVPWGLIYTPWAVWVNLTGGVDETDAFFEQLPDTTRPAAGSIPATGTVAAT